MGRPARAVPAARACSSTRPELIEFIPEGTAIAVTTAVIARPLAALLVAYGFTLPERLILGWAGLRGATPIVFATFPVTEGIAHGDEIFQVAFFVVLLSTILQGLTIEPVARWLGVTSDEAAIPVPLVEPVILNRLGAETMQFPVRAGDAIEGRPVRELGLPREALLNVIVRGERAIPPRGSTIIQEGDQLHVLVRQEVAVEFRELMRRWRTGPVGPPERPRRQPRSRPSVTSIRPWQDSDGDPQRPRELSGNEVIEQLRTRRDEPGALVVLEDGRFAVCGPLLAIGPSGELQAFARRRLAQRLQPGRAGLVAGGRRRAGALGRTSELADRRAGAVEREHRRGDDERDAEAEGAEAERAQVRDLGSGADAGRDAARAVPVHHDHRPAAGLRRPRSASASPGRPRCPARSAGRARGCRVGSSTWR